MNNKVLFILFTLFATLIGTSCSSDKDSDLNTSYIFKDGNFTYNGSTAPSNVILSIDFENSDKATIAIQNGVVGNPDLRISGVPMKPTKGGYTFEAIDNNNDREITISGTILNEQLTATSEVTFKTDLIGKWLLKRMPVTEDIQQADFFFNFKASTEEGAEYEGFNFFVVMFAGQKLHTAVEIVSLDFKKNGTLDIYYKVPTGTESAFPGEMNIPLEYFIKDGKMNIAIPAALIDEMLPALLPEGLGIKAEDVKAIFTKVGNHYALQLSNNLEGDYNLFYMDITPIMKKFAPIIVSIIPENGIEGVMEDGQWLKDYVTHLGEAKTLEIGLGFDRVK